MAQRADHIEPSSIGEDRRVKNSFQENYRQGIYSRWSEGVLRPSLEEVRKNPRSKSAKLRSSYLATHLSIQLRE
jgi:16S rRNA C1402 N4-methylase RsmH